jgi:hypothetical protein
MMTFYVLTQTGQVVSRSSVERVKEIENGTDEMKRKLEEFDTDIKRGLKFEDLGTDGDKPNPEKSSSTFTKMMVSRRQMLIRRLR